MQNRILALALFLLTGIAAVAQCDKKVKWYGSKAEMIDDSGNVLDTKQATIIITTASPKLILDIVEDPNDKLEGFIDSTACEWQETFKNGKTVLKSALMRMDGNTIHSILTIEGKEGKLTATLEMTRPSGERRKFRVSLDRYELSE